MKNYYLDISIGKRYTIQVQQVLLSNTLSPMSKIIYDKETVSLGTYKGKPLELIVSAHQMDHGPFIEYTIEASCPNEKNVIRSANDGIHPFSLLGDDDLDIDNPCKTGDVVVDNNCTRMLLREICDVNKTQWGHTGPQNIVCVLINALTALWD